jgi:hypothetical protein
MYYKYPRTLHLPFSRSKTDDDKVHKNLDFIKNKNMLVTVKMDGESCTMYNDHIHARSISSGNHHSRDWVKYFHSTIKHEIPPGWRICGENLYAEHSIHYDNLESYFYGFSVWIDGNICLDWEETKSYFSMLGITPVEELYNSRESYSELSNEEILKCLVQTVTERGEEGYVVRNFHGFHFDDFKENVGKWVRPNHVTTDQHWMHKELIKNGLKI